MLRPGTSIETFFGATVLTSHDAVVLLYLLAVGRSNSQVQTVQCIATVYISDHISNTLIPLRSLRDVPGWRFAMCIANWD